MPLPTPTASCITSVYPHGTDVVVSLRGEMDIATAPDITTYLDALTRAAPDGLLIDLREVVFMDSAGVRVLIRTRDRTEGRLRLICTRWSILRLLLRPGLWQRRDVVDRLPPPAPRRAV